MNDSPGFRVQNPTTNEIAETFETIGDEEVEQTLSRAEPAYRDWQAKSLEERADVVRRVGELFTERRDDLAEIIAEEMGKPVNEGREEAEYCGEIFGYFADNGPRFAADQEIPTESEGKAYIQRLPIGVLLGIMPWNFPYYQVARFAAPNLVLGNAILLKHAEICPRSARAIQQIMDDAGIPDGVYNNVFITHDQASEIIGDPRVQGVSLTGSERAGSTVAATAGQHLKKAVLELGGSDPYIILDTDDVKEAAQTAWETRMYNTGQACDSNKRMIVAGEVYDEFVEELVSLASAMEPGDPRDESPQVYSPLSSRSAAEKLEEQVEKAVSEGATLHVGGKLRDDSSAYFSPAVITGITPGSETYYEELFGPVAVVYQADSDDDAVRLANDSRYGLGGCVFSTDSQRAQAVAQRLEVGMASVNVPGGEGAELPFGGVKNSGYGRELGPLGMDEFVNKRMYFVSS